MENKYESLDSLNITEAIELQAKVLGYAKLPPTIREFCNNDYYLGQQFGDGGIYPYWMEVLERIYPTPIHTAYPFVIYTGPIGGGKSTITKIQNLYTLCRIGHLADFKYFGIVLTKTLDFVMCHTSNAKAYSDLVMSSFDMYGKSPYFTSEFKWSDSMYKYVCDGPRTNNSIGGDAIFYHFSEVNFIPYHTAKYKIDQAFDRYKSRFLRIMNYFGGIVIDSSSAGDESIVDYLIKEYPGGLLVIRDPIWVVKKHLGIYGRAGWFKVYCGDAVTEPFIISEAKPLGNDQDPDRVIDVPMELFDNYTSNITLSLQNTAGVSTVNTDIFFTDKVKLKAAYTIPNHIQEIVVVDFYDDEQYWEYIMLQIKLIPLDKKLSIGIDVGVTGDLLGFAISHFEEYIYVMGRATIEYTTKTPVIVNFSRKPGQETGITKIYNLVKRISDHGYEVGVVTTDQYQSTQLRQDFNKIGIWSYLSSVDRTQDPYIHLKVMIYKGFASIVKNKINMKEMAELLNDGYKIDHPAGGSKDSCDALCNSLWAIRCNLEYMSQQSSKYSINTQLAALRQLSNSKEMDEMLKSRMQF